MKCNNVSDTPQYFSNYFFNRKETKVQLLTQKDLNVELCPVRDCDANLLTFSFTLSAEFSE